MKRFREMLVTSGRTEEHEVIGPPLPGVQNSMKWTEKEMLNP